MCTCDECTGGFTDNEDLECGSCGADLYPSSQYPWHYPDEDCRAIRDPIPEDEDGETRARRNMAAFGERIYD